MSFPHPAPNWNPTLLVHPFTFNQLSKYWWRFTIIRFYVRSIHMINRAMHPTCSTKCHREASWHIGMKHRSKFIMGTQKHQRPHGLILKIEITTKFEGLGTTISSPTRNDRENSEDVNGNGKADMAERRHLATVSVLTTTTLATSMAARQGPIAMAAHQICLQVWLAVSLITDALAASGQENACEHEHVVAF
ncbi:hypothetical protein L2E82_35448 [Cichorium intybus]|uniref:Uncharacterized protein n=1 Tax=Cichorium intybus TaxID=13427 RepID=A0ACB9BNT5_CICIN|nr:hypothetical protein L2E82_35448 [Cichorium intybus]